MNALTEKINGDYVPKCALVIYTWNSENHGNDFYIEHHAINKEGALLAGKPLTCEHLDDLAEMLHERQKAGSHVCGEMPDNILFMDWSERRRVLVWYNPPKDRQMYFTKDLKVKNGVAGQPGLIYVLSHDELNVYAFSSTQGRPAPTEQLYRAPYFNVSEDGDVCLGSAHVAKPRSWSYMSILQYWEEMFWKSEFSHLADNESPIKDNLSVFWNQQIEGHKEFDYSVLLPAGEETLSSIIKRLSK